MPVDAKRAQQIFLAALEAASPTERAALLDRDCAGDPELRGRVEALLRAHDEPDGPLDRPADDGLTGPVAPAAADPDGPIEGVGSVLAGRYKLLEAIGEGGMGAVFMAQQTEPVRRLVAVKLIKAGMDSRQVLARFEAERQALALMDHPNIAKVLDAGATDAGRPFFVMELVKGVPITKFCDDRKLTPRQRLELFVPVCQAIQHAHQKGVIHRDVKPSNVLVALYDDRPVPKVIDFGVAKAAGPQLTEHTLATGFGAVIGTLEYMSPEQASFNALDVDTRSDVYALGVLLYEMLTGTTPLDRKRLGRAALAEMLRLVREEEAPKPSIRLSSSEALPSIAANRQTEPAKLSRLLRGELDWVVLKALEKDRSRRYETANGLARDVGRYLADEVVEARPPSVGYRLRKFVKRNKGRVLAAAAVLLALVGGVVGTTLGMVRALDAESKALAAASAERTAKEAEGKAKDAAERRLAQIEKGIDILGSVFKDLDPHTPEKEGKPWQAVLGERLDQATTQLDGEAVGDPLAVAKLQMTLGESQLGLGYAEKAIVLFTRARETYTARLGPDRRETLTSMGNLARAYRDAGKLDLALPLGEETLKLMKTKLGPDDSDLLLEQVNLGVNYKDAGKLDLALPLLEETLKLMKAKLGPDHHDTLACMNNLAGAYRDAGKLDLAVPLFEETLKLMKAKLGPDHPYTVQTQANLGVNYEEAGRFDEAIPLLEDALNHAAKHPERYPEVLKYAASLADAYDRAGRFAQAEPLYRKAVEDAKTRFGPDDPRTAVAMARLAYNLTWQSNQEAVPLLRASLAVFLKKEPDAWTLSTQSVLGGCLLRMHKDEEAEPLLRACLAFRQKKEPDAWTTFNTQSELGDSLFGQKKYEEAEPLLLAGYEGMEKRADEIPMQGKAHLAEAAERLVRLYDALDRPDKADALREKWEAAKNAADKKPPMK